MILLCKCVTILCLYMVLLLQMDIKYGLGKYTFQIGKVMYGCMYNITIKRNCSYFFLLGVENF